MFSESEDFFVGVDVGTGSVRAALVTSSGRVLKTQVHTIQTWNVREDFYEQSSDDIWKACCKCVKDVASGFSKRVAGIGFDATCSLVALDGRREALPVSEDGRGNIILWMDHRAVGEADTVNKQGHEVLKFLGGTISPEMEIPKLMWIKKNHNSCWTKAAAFYDLPDFLTWKATGTDSRSICSLGCKWAYRSDNRVGWDKNFFREVGLEDLLENGAFKIGNRVQNPGNPVGNGLSKRAAQELGLVEGTPVGTSMIDAHAGGLALLGCQASGISPDFSTRLGLICGTSTCHMSVTEEPIFAKGIWGPYREALIPDMWLNEGGQSATGLLVDHIIDIHPASEKIRKTLQQNTNIHVYLSKLLETMAQNRKVDSVAYLTKDLHIWPDFHGNRSPVADPTLKGTICGLTLSTDEENLALLYLATLQAVSYGTRHILDTLNNSRRRPIECVLICGGLTKNPLFVQTQADVVNLPVVCPNESESVLLGASMLGACASGRLGDLAETVKTMGGRGSSVRPNAQDVQYHNKKYGVFLKMLDDQLTYREIMK